MVTDAIKIKECVTTKINFYMESAKLKKRKAKRLLVGASLPNITSLCYSWEINEEHNNSLQMNH